MINETCSAPGDSAFLAAIRYIHLPISITILLQIAFNLIAISLIFFTAITLFKSVSIAASAALLFALHPNTIMASSNLLHFSLSTLLFLFVFYLLITSTPHPAAKHFVIGLPLGMACLAQPAALAFLPIPAI